MKIAGSGAGSESGSVSQRYGSAEELDQKVTDPQHCLEASLLPFCLVRLKVENKSIRNQYTGGNPRSNIAVLLK